MKNLFKRGLLAATAIAIPATAILASPLAAHAAVLNPVPVTAVTHSIARPDTTSVSGTGTIASADGPVWAHDNLTFRLVDTRVAPNTWSVTIFANGTYQANANPLTGAPWLGHGAINGWLNYEVSSPTAPNAEYVPYLEPASFSQTSIVNQMFGGTGTVVGGGHYDYTYSGVPGWPYGLYTQVG
jgi:hypothetical protein